ncbi:glycine-rich domain-containing protein [Sediminitomix flava]|uniref:Uncharacterized protein n=1 Tax=Sediminitomix flava TaxID=379075 RepID=A0A315Z0P7_SEDFL|nr:hypothetical protein [Sediminitomix flava]PWJ36132.1 hypothetical protein BC781_109148 [Sediminitomix flava]
MNEHEKELWENIRSYQIGAAQSALSFSDRLARENNWSLKYALRVIFEYKKFIFLICVDKGPFTPSDEVDQAWHLHLLYTEDYWEDFCGELLQTKIHHGPTKGGQSERVKYTDLYEQTLKRYESFFGEKPPSDIWPSTEIRFSKVNFIRVLKEDYFFIPKKLKTILSSWKNLKK